MAVRTDVFTPVFLEALRDYRWLADQGYPARRTAEFVGDRYALSKSQRSILYRGVYSRLESMRRMEKRTLEIPSGPLHIDGFNVILCVANYLAGRTVYVATDGFLRDDGEASEGGVDWERAEEAAGLVCGFLLGLPDTSPVFLLDSAVPAAESLAAFITRSIRGYGFASGTAAAAEAAAPEARQGAASRITAPEDKQGAASRIAAPEGLTPEPRRGSPRPGSGSAAEARITAPEDKQGAASRITAPEDKQGAASRITAPEGLTPETRRGSPRPGSGSAAEARITAPEDRHGAASRITAPEDRHGAASRITAPEIIITRNPDSLLSSRTQGCIATSDSIVIDRSSLPVCDLPRAVLFSLFHPVIADLGAFLPLSTIQENR